MKDWEFSFHDLRRLKARAEASVGGIEQAKAYLGHSSLAVTRLYLDNNQADLAYLKLVSVASEEGEEEEKGD